MPTVVDVFDHFGGFQVRPNQWGVEFLIERRQGITTGGVQLSDYRLWRVIEILDRRAFPQEFGIVTNAKVDTCFFARKLLENGNNDVVHGSRQDRAANDDSMPSCLVLEGLANLLANAPDIPQIEVAVGLARGAYANKGQLRFMNSLGLVGSRAQPA